MNNLRAVVDRLVHETGLSRAVSRRIAQKINRMAGKVNWATALQSPRPSGFDGGARASAKPRFSAAPPSGSRVILPKILAPKPAGKGSAVTAPRRSR